MTDPGAPYPPPYVAPAAPPPPPPATFAGYGQSPILPPPPAPPRGRRIAWGVAIGVVVLLVCGGAVTALVIGLRNASATTPAAAQVGSCLAGTSVAQLNADHLRIVSCDSSTAAFRVIQVADNKLSSEADGACTDPATQYVFWSGKHDKPGYVLCLAAVTT
jgi:hypothetical protein